MNVDDGAVAITGGWNGTQPFLGQSVQVDKWKYIELNKQAAWFIKGVAGGKNLRGDLKQVKLLELIREKMKLLHEEPLPDTAVAELGDAAVAESQESQESIADPMEQLDEVKPIKDKGKSKAKSREGPCVRQIVVPN